MPPAGMQQWIVKDVEGRIYGPFSTEQVIKQIDQGYFQGGEEVALYPGGSWIAISKAPEFYDRLLDALAAEVRNPQPSASRVVRSDSMASKAQPPSPPPEKESTQSRAFEPTPTPRELTPLPYPHKGIESASTMTKNPQSSTMSQGPVIELTDLKQLEAKEKLRNSRLPLIFVVAALCLAGAALLWPMMDENSGHRIHLVAPRDRQPPLPLPKIREKYNRALTAFQSDTFSGYTRAQDELIEGIEGLLEQSGQLQAKAQMLAMLCRVYRELWPYAFQDSQDMKVVSTVLQFAKRADPGGPEGATCQVVSMLANGRYKEAERLTESVLVEHSRSSQFLEIRGDLYMNNSQNFEMAANYFSRARELEEKWKKTAIQEARARIRLKQFPAGMQLYKSVIQASPKHSVALIELGIVETEQFGQLEKGMEYLTSALRSDERAPPSVEGRAYFMLASIYEKRNQASKALEFAKKAYALNSANLAAKQMIERLAGKGEADKTKFEGRELVYLGDQYLRAGDCFSAQAQFKAAFDVDGKNAVAAMKAGQCLWKLNQSSEAIEWLNKAIKVDPELIIAYVELADYYAQRFDYQSAVLILKRAQRVATKNYEIFRGFATVELRRNNFAGAKDFAQKALTLYEGDVETNLLMAKAQIGLQEFAEAQRYAQKVFEVDSNNPTAHILIARAEVGLRGVASGAEILQGLINRFVLVQGQQVPEAVIEYRIALGEIFLQDDRFKQAEDEFRLVLSLDTDNKKAMINLGRALQAQNMAPAALEYFLKAAVLDASDADPIFLSGQVYLEVGKTAEALRQFERVLKINPRYPRAHVQVGRTALFLKDAKRALDEAMLEREINPEMADSYLLAGEAYFDLKQYSNCAQEYQKAVSKRPQGASVYVQMARCYRLAGALDSAQSLIRQAQTLESGNPDLYKEQGAIFHMKGMADDAIAAYDTYLKLVPNAPDRFEVEERIRKVQAGDMTVNN